MIAEETAPQSDASQNWLWAAELPPVEQYRAAVPQSELTHKKEDSGYPAVEGIDSKCYWIGGSLKKKLLETKERKTDNWSAIKDEGWADGFPFIETLVVFGLAFVRNPNPGHMLLAGTLSAIGVLILICLYFQGRSIEKEYKDTLRLWLEYDDIIQARDSGKINQKEASSRLEYLYEKMDESYLLFEGIRGGIDIEGFDRNEFLHIARKKGVLPDFRTKKEKSEDRVRFEKPLISSRATGKVFKVFCSNFPRLRETFFLAKNANRLALRTLQEFRTFENRHRKKYRTRFPEDFFTIHPDHPLLDRYKDSRDLLREAILRTKRDSFLTVTASAFWIINFSLLLFNTVNFIFAPGVLGGLLIAMNVFSLNMSTGPIREASRELQHDYDIIESKRFDILELSVEANELMNGPKEKERPEPAY